MRGLALTLGGSFLAATALSGAAHPAPNGRLAVTVAPVTSFSAGLWVVGADGRGARTIVQTTRIAIRDPSWSPSGKRIVFAVTRDPVNEHGYDIYVADSDGSHVRRLTSGGKAESAYAPAWSPDGATIAFAKSRSAGAPAIWLMRPDGRERHRLTDGWAPAWSPDGHRLVLTNESLLWVVRRDGRGLRRLTPRPPAGHCDFSGGESADYDGAPDWSPGGGSIAFVRYCGSGEEPRDDSIYVVHPDGTGLRRLTNGREDDSPSWSPDSRRLAFVHNGAVYVISRGRTRKLFAPPRGQVFEVAWQR